MSFQSFDDAVLPVTAYSTPGIAPTVAGRIVFRRVSSASFEVASVPDPTSGISTRITLPFGEASE